MNTNYKLNIEKSPDDKRDWTAEKVYASSLMKDGYIDLRDVLEPVRDQGNQGSCAALASSTMKEYQEAKDIDYNGYLSPQFIYNHRENKESQGMYPRDLMRILQKVGTVPEELYPYGTKDSISNNLINEAKNYKIKNYARIYTQEELNIALNKNGVCLIAVPVYNYGMKMWKREENQQPNGGHMMAVVGRNKEGYIIRNSWGEDWGNKGYTILPYNEWMYIWECWTTVDESSSKPDFKSKFSRFFYKIWNWLKIRKWIFIIIGFVLLAPLAFILNPL